MATTETIATLRAKAGFMAKAFEDPLALAKYDSARDASPTFVAVHDWRRYARNVLTPDLWYNISIEARLAAGLVAEDIADQEEWD